MPNRRHVDLQQFHRENNELFRARKLAGFSLIELIVLMTITVILAVAAVPALMDPGPLRLQRAARETAAHIKMARDLAVATRRRTWVDFDVSGNSYSVYIEDPDNPGKSHRIWVTHPEMGGNFHVQLNTGDFAGVEIASAKFKSGWFFTRSEVEFDRLGTPYDGNGGSLSSDGTVVLSTEVAGGGCRGGHAGGLTVTVRVVEETGMVQED